MTSRYATHPTIDRYARILDTATRAAAVICCSALVIVQIARACGAGL